LLKDQTYLVAIWRGNSQRIHTQVPVHSHLCSGKHALYFHANVSPNYSRQDYPQYVRNASFSFSAFLFFFPIHTQPSSTYLSLLCLISLVVEQKTRFRLWWRACIGAPLSLDYWRAFIRGIGAWKETFLLTIASVCSARLNGPWCIRVTCQAVINANRMKGLIKRDKCRH